MASTADGLLVITGFRLVLTVVLVTGTPQIRPSEPPAALITRCVRFTLAAFSQVGWSPPAVPQACVPQNPGVRQIPSAGQVTLASSLQSEFGWVHAFTCVS